MKSSIRMTNSRHKEIQRELDDLGAGLNILKIKYNKAILKKFRIYLEVLFKMRSRLHLLSHQDYERIAKRHFLTSLMALDFVKGYYNICDIGAGAGFPSLPLKIIKPTMKLTLIESNKKKADFLQYLTEELGYPDVGVVNERAQDYQEKTFEVILLKAVGKIKKLIVPINSLIEPGGRAIFYKTHRVKEEIKQTKKDLGEKGFHLRVEKLFTPLERLPLALVILDKNQ